MLGIFCPARKTLPDRASVHTQKMVGEGGGGTDFCDGAKLRPGPKEESLVGDGGEVLPIYGLYRFSIYTLSDLGDLSNLIGSLSIAMFENSTKIYF